MAFRSYAHWTGTAARAAARRVVTRLCCIGPLAPADVDDLRRMADLRDLTLEGIETFPRALCDLVHLRSLTINRRGEDGISSLPAEIRNLAALRTLRIRARKMTELPDVIADLDALVELDLRHSGIRKLPERLMEVPKLRRIIVAR
jgi:Leucine-rich repeat (LRR) protein